MSRQVDWVHHLDEAVLTVVVDYETAVRRWAAKKLDCTPDEIERVEFQTDAGWWGTDVTGGDPASFGVFAVMKKGRDREVMEFDPSGGMYERKRWDFATLLGEILAES